VCIFVASGDRPVCNSEARAMMVMHVLLVKGSQRCRICELVLIGGPHVYNLFGLVSLDGDLLRCVLVDEYFSGLPV